jgi:hypothetical protein
LLGIGEITERERKRRENYVRKYVFLLPGTQEKMMRQTKLGMGPTTFLFSPKQRRNGREKMIMASFTFVSFLSITIFVLFSSFN